MKILFFDIDGTLIDAKHEMLDSTKAAISEARKNGHLCFINTGRSRFLVEGSISEMAEFDGFVMGCGTMISVNGRVLHHQSFSPELGARIAESLVCHKIDAVLEGSDNIFFRKPEELFTEPFYRYRIRFIGRSVGDYADAPGNFDKFYCYADDRAFVMDFYREFQEELDFIDRERGFFEFVPRGCSKGAGIKRLVEELKLSMEDTVALGDSNNDMEMMKTAHISIAMGNATQGIKDIADYVTTNVDQDGIRNALLWLGVIGG